MKVLHVIHSLSQNRGGPSHAAIEMVRALRTRGVDAEIATLDDCEASFSDSSAGNLIEFKGVPVRFFPRSNFSVSAITEYGLSLPLRAWLRTHITKYDIVHTHYLFTYASTCAARVANRFNVPYIVSPIGQLTSWALAQSKTRKNIYSLLLEKSNLNYASAIHCTTEGEKKDVKRFGVVSKPFILPLGVELPVPIGNAKKQLRQRYDLPKETFKVLFLSRLHYKKRPDTLIRAVSYLINELNTRVSLIIAGSGDEDYEKELKQLVIQLNVSNHTTFTGFVTGTSKDILLQGSDIFVLPSHSENFGVAVVEAMAAHRPVVVTPGVQLCPDINSFNAGIVTDGEPLKLAKTIKTLSNDHDLNLKLGCNARKLVEEKYVWNRLCQKLEQEYKMVLKK